MNRPYKLRYLPLLWEDLSYAVIDDVMEVRRLLYKSRDIESIIR